MFAAVQWEASMQVEVGPSSAFAGIRGIWSLSINPRGIRIGRAAATPSGDANARPDAPKAGPARLGSWVLTVPVVHFVAAFSSGTVGLLMDDPTRSKVFGNGAADPVLRREEWE